MFYLNPPCFWTYIEQKIVQAAMREAEMEFAFHLLIEGIYNNDPIMKRGIRSNDIFRRLEKKLLYPK